MDVIKSIEGGSVIVLRMVKSLVTLLVIVETIVVLSMKVDVSVNLLVE